MSGRCHPVSLRRGVRVPAAAPCGKSMQAEFAAGSGLCVGGNRR